jgi:DNA-binding transcriptional regulator YdaS (Cro superfamily)
MNLRDYLSDVNSRRELARALGKSPDYLYQVATERRQASPLLAIEIEGATKGAVSRHDLRPDIFGTAPSRPQKRAA